MNELSKQLINELDAMWRFALRLTSNQADAEDLVQRTCLSVLENKSGYQEQGRLRSWLFRIEHRIWLNVLRSRQIRHAGSFKHAPLKTDLPDEPTPDSRAIIDTESTGVQSEWANAPSPEAQLQLQKIYEQVESLPEAQRLVVGLVCVEGFTYQETAQVLDIPIGTVMSRLARARITLGKAMLHSSNTNKSAEVDGATVR